MRRTVGYEGWCGAVEGRGREEERKGGGLQTTSFLLSTESSWGGELHNCIL